MSSVSVLKNKMAEISFTVVDVGIPCKANPDDVESLRKKQKGLV